MGSKGGRKQGVGEEGSREVGEEGEWEDRELGYEGGREVGEEKMEGAKK